MRKRVPIATVVVVLTAFLLLFSVSCTNDPQSPNKQLELTPVSRQLEALLIDYLNREAELHRMKVLDLKVIPVSQANDGQTAEAVFSIQRTYIFDYSQYEDSPALRARIRFLEENRTVLSPDELAVAEADVWYWKGLHDEYANEPRQSFMRRRIVAPVQDGRVDPQGVVLYAKIDDAQPQGKLVSWVPISLADIPSEQQLEEEAVAAIKERIEVFRQSRAVVGTQ